MKTRRLSIAVFAAALALTGCAVVPDSPGPQLAFFERLRSLCGNAYQGRLVSADEADRDFAASSLVMHVRTCSAHEVRIPFHVGDDHSRTWVVSRAPATLKLKHVHRHEDGSEDVLSRYGGDTLQPGTSRRQEFPADEYSRDLFRRAGNPASVDNIWAVEVIPGEMFAYELRRPNRHFRVEFDLTRPVSPPPPPWGEG
jgi:hypothetical protein